MPDDIPHELQVTPAHVLQALSEFKVDVNARLDALRSDVAEVQSTVKESGLNGHTPYLKAFLEQYAATYSTRQAWLTVRSDLRHKLRFLAPGKHWLTVLFGAIIGGFGWQVASGHFPPHF